MKNILNFIGHAFLLLGALLAGPFSLLFAHGGGAHWETMRWWQQIPGRIVWVVLAVPMLVGMPIMMVGEWLYNLGQKEKGNG